MDNNSKGSPFIYNDPVIPPIFAGRRHELTYINQALFQKKESLVVYGNDAIGKSSLIGTVYNTLNKTNSGKIFPVRINAFDFIKAVEDNFLGITTHQICAAIWTKLLNKKYSELIEDTLQSEKKLGLLSEEEKTIKRIFRIVTSEKITGTGRMNKEIGGEFFVKGNLSHSNEIVNVRKALAPFEFLHLLDELIDIIKSYNYTSIIVFCDELNHLPEKTNTDILRNYFNIFSSNQIQFVIVVVNPEMQGKENAQKLIESFNSKLELGTFKTINDVDELINNSLQTVSRKIAFDSECSSILYDFTEGHPWWIQKICDNSYNAAQAKNIDVISPGLITSVSKEFSDEIAIYRDKIASGLPFRKYNLYY